MAPAAAEECIRAVAKLHTTYMHCSTAELCRKPYTAPYMGDFYNSKGKANTHWRLMQLIFDLELKTVLAKAAAGEWAETPWPDAFVSILQETVAYAAEGFAIDSELEVPLTLVYGYLPLPKPRSIFIFSQVSFQRRWCTENTIVVVCFSFVVSFFSKTNLRNF